MTSDHPALLDEVGAYVPIDEREAAMRDRFVAFRPSTPTGSSAVAPIGVARSDRRVRAALAEYGADESVLRLARKTSLLVG